MRSSKAPSLIANESSIMDDLLGNSTSTSFRWTASRSACASPPSSVQATRDPNPPMSCLEQSMAIFSGLYACLKRLKPAGRSGAKRTRVSTGPR
ncbi:hypothetical protein NL676_029325 [Syzygium grande]|nr:hypothetical protein NL676_029325 [Syzygium grande]